MKVKSVIFDLDGTLIDSIPDITETANQMLLNHQFPTHSAADYISWIGNGALRLVRKALPKEFSETETQKFLNEYLELYTEMCTHGTMVYKGIPEVLDYLTKQGIGHSILTNKPHEVTQKVVNYYFPGNVFNFVFGQRQGVAKKPDPSAALEIASNLNCLPEDVLFIGDSDTDMKTGKAAGMIAVGVTWGYGSVSSIKAAGSDYLFDTTEGLINLISKLNKE